MIKYKRIQMPSKGIEARPIQGKQVSTKEIATEIEKVIGIPAIRTMSVLSAFVEMAYNHFENGEPVEISKGGFSYGDGPMIEVYAMTQEQYDTVNGLIENTNRIMRYDQSLMEIINDEAGAFFAGEKTAEETAQLIQNRVQLYMAEQG
mgnify:CR=1 FL=1